MWAAKAPVSGELYSVGGRVLLHPSRAEIEFLCPGIQMVWVRGDTYEAAAMYLGREVMRWQDHPDMPAVRWPLDRRDFR